MPHSLRATSGQPAGGVRPALGRGLATFLLLAASLAGGCCSLECGTVTVEVMPYRPAAGMACCGEEGPKTLFEWAEGKDCKKGDKGKGKGNGEKNGNGEGEKDGGSEDGKDADAKSQGENGKKDGEDNGKKNGNGEGKNNGDGDDEGKEDGNGEEEEDGEDTIETDRPDFTEASSTVGRGRIQLEVGYTFTSDRQDGVRTRSHSYPEALLRIGLFADWFELRLGQNFGDTRVNDGVTEPQAGAEDLYLGTKLALTEQKKWKPETALILQTTVPTGADALSANQMLPGFNYLFGWDVVEDCLSTGGSFQVNRARDDVDHYYVEVAQSMTVGYRLTRRVGAYTEWFAFYPTSSLDPGVGPEHYFDGGFTYLVTPNFQLDVRAGVGLNEHADDFFAGTGFAVRY